MTRKDIISRLSAAGIDCADYEAGVIIEHIFGRSLQKQLLDKERDYSSPELEELIKKREAHTPLAYIIGRKDFFRESYILNEGCLIPRSDTELIVELACRHAKADGRICDLCTGSGCIAISTLANRPDLSGVGFDISPLAIEAAKENARLNGVFSRISFFAGDIFELNLEERFDMILSNPPYIPTKDIEGLMPEVRDYEPTAALDGGFDGLMFYRAIIDRFSGALADNGCFLFEIGYDQGGAISAIANEKGFSCTLYRDLGGNIRGAMLNRC